MSHLKASNSEAAGVMYGGDYRDQVGAVGDVLIVELHRHLVVTWKHLHLQLGPLALICTFKYYCQKTEKQNIAVGTVKIFIETSAKHLQYVGYTPYTTR